MEKPKLDFSQFHPLDHWPWERRCWSKEIQPGWETPFYGGPRHHLKIAWEYKYRDYLLIHLHKNLLCHFGKHYMMKGWNPHEQEYFESCLACGGNRRTLSPDEVPDWIKRFNDLW